MADALVEEYIDTVRADAAEQVRVLAAAIDAAGRDFDRRITYGMLVYTFDARWHRWVVAVGVTKKAANLRFRFGDRLDDPAGLLRAGSSTASTIDFAALEDIDPDLVTAYVTEAAEKHPREG